jgi:hypothetical protein
MSGLDFLRRIAQCAGGIYKKYCLLLGAHQTEEEARLSIVIIILTMIPMVSGTF